MDAATHPFDSIVWNRREAVISDDDGARVFALGDVEAPAGWSDSAVNVVASRYFRGDPRETSVREMMQRVGGTLASWVVAQGLGGDDFEYRLLEILVRQRAAFNSPVWFNVGVDAEPQCSACFILSVRDDMRSILELVATEGLVFQRGSGCGTNLSPLRSSREAIAGGGRASGPVSFMRGYDAFAGAVKSGGRTRRAAKMQILDVDHPDILEFVDAKRREEDKARALIAAGFAGGLDGEAYRSVAFQNANLSVRVSDAFMEAVAADDPWALRAPTTSAVVERIPARSILRQMAEGAWVCGDPGIQYSSTIESWNPCKASGSIQASNPCGEYLFLNDSACNLASLNLLRFLRADATFDIAAFRGDTDALLRTMEAIVDRSSYPTPDIVANSRRFRPLGLGYANLGALLMSLGLPYDSAEARAWAASITALMTGEAYKTSATMARDRGPFDAWQSNRASFLDVLERHRAALDDIVGAPAPILDAARAAWSDALQLAHKHGVRNAQTTLLAPTGTIAFLMDCDTTGVEPDLSLVKYKRLAGGGTLKLVNRTVPTALRRLGYDDAHVDRIVAYVEEHEMIEGAPGLRDAHLPVFDCAFRPSRGARAIAADGHLAMMAAAQPFLSGGISKTVNLPEDATVEDIERLYARAHKLGIKAFAVYRENSKGAQPLETGHCVVDANGGCCE